MFLEVDFGTPVKVNGVSLSTHLADPQLEIFGKTQDGSWTLLSNHATAERRPQQNLRLETIRSLKRAGIAYILTPVEGSIGNADLGNDLLIHAKEYGIVEVGRVDMLRLFRL
jgi:hypothetical protein